MYRKTPSLALSQRIIYGTKIYSFFLIIVPTVKHFAHSNYFYTCFLWSWFKRLSKMPSLLTCSKLECLINVIVLIFHTEKILLINKCFNRFNIISIVYLLQQNSSSMYPKIHPPNFAMECHKCNSYSAKRHSCLYIWLLSFHTCTSRSLSL